jgi:phage internal scaffolding protein
MSKNTLTYREKLGHPKYVDPGIDCSSDEILTEQSHIPECDINTILARYEKTGQFEDTPRTIENAFGDFGDIPDLQTVLNVGIEAQNAFMELPAKTRKRFNNSPAELWDFIHNKENLEESVALGLREKREEKTPQKDESVSLSTVTSSKADASQKGDAASGAEKKEK